MLNPSFDFVSRSKFYGISILAVAALLFLIVIARGIASRGDRDLEESKIQLQGQLTRRYKWIAIRKAEASEVARLLNEEFLEGKALGAAGVKPTLVFAGEATTQPAGPKPDPTCPDFPDVGLKFSGAVVDLTGEESKIKLNFAVIQDFGPEVKGGVCKVETPLAVDSGKVTVLAPVVEVPPEKPPLTIATAPTSKWHVGKGLVCGPGVSASVLAWPTLGGGVGPGVGCTYGWGIVK